ncbi:MAG TPA: hypothetical protein PKY82_21780 [Pyrinomonadaceae bacterium]|nr:hypothetical protein [Pyrinomonadaceae bacterium]
MKRYLYGEMSEDEVAKIENKIFLDDNYFYDIVNFENELIDLYVRKKLDPDELIRFEKSLKSSPERQTKVANAIALQTIIEEARPVENPIEAVKPNFWESIKKFFTLHTLVASSAMTAFLLMFLIVPIVVLILLNLRSSSSLVAGNTYKGNSNSNRIIYGNSATPIMPGNGSSNPPKANMNGAIPIESATRTPLPPDKIVVLKPATNTEISVENGIKSIIVKLILPDSVNNGTFLVKINENGQPIKVSSQTEENQKVLNFKFSFDKFPQGTTKIIVQDATGNINLEYPFTLRQR